MTGPPRLDGVTDLEPLHGGRQSRVWRGRRDGQHLVLKVVAAAHFADAGVAERFRLQSLLADRTDLVCRPLVLDGIPVRTVEDPQLGPSSLTVYAFAEGARPHLPGDAALMGSTLAVLHAAMSTVPPSPIGPMRSLVDTSVERFHAVGLDIPPDVHDPFAGAETSRLQLVHGDYTDANVLVAAGAPTVIDFDDCGYGHVEQDLANALYSVLFDAVTQDEPRRYDDFRSAFLDAYTSSASTPVSRPAIDRSIRRRAWTLALWLADASTAPAGIATAEESWRQTLRRFTTDQLGLP